MKFLLLLFVAVAAGAAAAANLEYSPLRYKIAHGDNSNANVAWKKSLTWREENNIYDVLKLPNKKFDKIKLFCPHFFPGCDKNNNVIFVQCPYVGERSKRSKATNIIVVPFRSYI